MRNHVSVVAIAAREEGEPMKIVLVHSREHKDEEPYLKFPGGRRKNGENPEETAVREVGEETGLRITKDELIPVVTLERFGKGEWYDYHIYLAVVDSLEGLKSEYVEEDNRVLIIVSMTFEALDTFPMQVLHLHRPYIEDLKEVVQTFAG